jgi:Protein of unknown function DUF262/HNH endonuclease
LGFDWFEAGNTRGEVRHIEVFNDFGSPLDPQVFSCGGNRYLPNHIPWAPPHYGSLGVGGDAMALRVNMDAMIRREDFAREIKGEPPPDTIRELNLSMLLADAPIRRQLRKPDFQRETNHWTPDQVVRFLTSFVDGAVIPGIILWRSTNFIFVIDGAHRLSALCAWISDDYGDRNLSKVFYSDEITDEQKKVAVRTRRLVEKSIGTFASLNELVGKAAAGIPGRRAGSMFTKPIAAQTVPGDAQVAEDSFFAINSQGTPLDETETLLIRNRRKPVAIGARAIVRAGTGHPYWSTFSQKLQKEVVEEAAELHRIIFEPEAATPLKTLDLPLGGSSSPIDALAVLLDFLTVANSKSVNKIDDPSDYDDDTDGDGTLKVLKEGLRIARRITGNSPASLGLHPAVYFTNDKGKHSRFLFLGMVAAITDKLRNNDDNWFRKFTRGRKKIEKFLLDNKSAIGVILQNLSRKRRIPAMRELFEFLVEEAEKASEAALDPVKAFEKIGISGKVFDMTVSKQGVAFSDDTKSQIFYRKAVESAQRCPVCDGLLDVTKSVSYDHVVPKRSGGIGSAENGQMVHPYCNSAVKA